jgi:hypothetical protein
MAANRVGKTVVGAYETTVHMTGEYPAWWEGRRFDRSPFVRRIDLVVCALTIPADTPIRTGSDMDHKVSALERAFQLAKSGRMRTVDEIRNELKREGYDHKAVEGGRSLTSQLRDLIKAAHLKQKGPPDRR